MQVVFFFFFFLTLLLVYFNLALVGFIVYVMSSGHIKCFFFKKKKGFVLVGASVGFGRLGLQLQNLLEI